MVKDKKKIKAVLSAVALSVHLGFSTQYINNHPEPVSPVEAQDRKVHKSMTVKVFGNVKSTSVTKAREILDRYLSDKVKDSLGAESYITLVESSRMEEYSRNKFHRSLTDLQAGEHVLDSEGVQIYCPEDMIDDILPIVATCINSKIT